MPGSAPGTKTTQLAAMMSNEGSILACDLHAHRLALVEEAAQRCGATIIQTQTLDAAQADQQLAGRQFDRVLLDVPCSGLGVLRHKPEILLRLTPASLDEIVALQAAILTHWRAAVQTGRDAGLQHLHAQPQGKRQAGRRVSASASGI